MGNDKAKKIIVYKQRPKKGYRVKRGHRQQYTRVMINKIRTTASKKQLKLQKQQKHNSKVITVIFN